jgi:hypothetical protein
MCDIPPTGPVFCSRIQQNNAGEPVYRNDYRGNSTINTGECAYCQKLSENKDPEVCERGPQMC